MVNSINRSVKYSFQCDSHNFLKRTNRCDADSFAINRRYDLSSKNQTSDHLKALEQQNIQLKEENSILTKQHHSIKKEIQEWRERYYNLEKKYVAEKDPAVVEAEMTNLTLLLKEHQTMNLKLLNEIDRLLVIITGKDEKIIELYDTLDDKERRHEKIAVDVQGEYEKLLLMDSQTRDRHWIEIKHTLETQLKAEQDRNAKLEALIHLSEVKSSVKGYETPKDSFLDDSKQATLRRESAKDTDSSRGLQSDMKQLIRRTSERLSLKSPKDLQESSALKIKSSESMKDQKLPQTLNDEDQAERQVDPQTQYNVLGYETTQMYITEDHNKLKVSYVDPYLEHYNESLEVEFSPAPKEDNTTDYPTSTNWTFDANVREVPSSAVLEKDNGAGNTDRTGLEFDNFHFIPATKSSLVIESQQRPCSIYFGCDTFGCNSLNSDYANLS